jgi:hypothetical protein
MSRRAPRMMTRRSWRPWRRWTAPLQQVILGCSGTSSRQLAMPRPFDLDLRTWRSGGSSHSRLGSVAQCKRVLAANAVSTQRTGWKDIKLDVKR